MNKKHLKITFWTVTALFCLANFASGLMELFPDQQVLDIFAQLGYPVYFLTILGTAKVLGAVAIIQTKYKTIKEWAYAGFAIDFLSASWSWYFVDGPLFHIITPWIFLAWLFVSYALWKKVE